MNINVKRHAMSMCMWSPELAGKLFFINWLQLNLSGYKPCVSTHCVFAAASLVCSVQKESKMNTFPAKNVNVWLPVKLDNYIAMNGVNALCVAFQELISPL